MAGPVRQLRQGGSAGFTLIELMISIVLFAVLVTAAVPSFISFRERSIVRGAAEQLIAAVSVARMEAVKRDQNVSVNMLQSGAAWCAGVVEVPIADDFATCDCFEKNSADADFCRLGAFPPLNNADAASGETQAVAGMRGARLLAAPDFGGDSVFSFDPKLGLLMQDDDSGTFDIGTVVVRSPSDEYDFRLQFDVGPSGRATLCVPSGGRAVAGYRNC